MLWGKMQWYRYEKVVKPGDNSRVDSGRGFKHEAKQQTVALEQPKYVVPRHRPVTSSNFQVFDKTLGGKDSFHSLSPI